MALAMVLSMGVRAQSAAEDLVFDTLNYRAFSGQVIDADNNRTLPFATVEAVGSNTATVTNIDGEFIIKLPRGTSVSSLKISYIGYSNKIVALGEFREGRTLTVLLEPSSIRLQEITIDQDGQQTVLRTPAHGCTAAVFKAVGMALPRHIKDAA